MYQLTFWGALGSMGLHGHVRVQMIECPVRFLAALPATLVHALDFFITATRTLVLLGTGNGNEGVDLRERVRTLRANDKRADARGGER